MKQMCMFTMPGEILFARSIEASLSSHLQHTDMNTKENDEEAAGGGGCLHKSKDLEHAAKKTDGGVYNDDYNTMGGKETAEGGMYETGIRRDGNDYQSVGGECDGEIEDADDLKKLGESDQKDNRMQA